MLFTQKTIICHVWYEFNMFEIYLLILSQSKVMLELIVIKEIRDYGWVLIRVNYCNLGPKNISNNL